MKHPSHRVIYKETAGSPDVHGGESPVAGMTEPGSMG
jgi:hypothetical protein